MGQEFFVERRNFDSAKALCRKSRETEKIISNLCAATQHKHRSGRPMCREEINAQVSALVLCWRGCTYGGGCGPGDRKPHEDDAEPEGMGDATRRLRQSQIFNPQANHCRERQEPRARV